ncbi:MAG: CDP-diacylglycerol--glycerol-3-phosphate 3-phosphatidyltransferase [Spirochaetes bacterium]|nr:CDP-diacylglycerol--glycerol-3-phosphate 3-phosphatidyltransferase [Spirochaetota bacterium]
MNLPNLLTSSRIYLSPVFFLSFYFPLWTGRGGILTLILLWAIYFLMEISDAVDGSLARALDQVTDTGKLLDPFADVVSRLTYFVCFVATGIMPAWAFILIMYREFGITYLRMILYREGYALAARKGGKLKAVLYAIAGGAGLFIHTCRLLGWFSVFMETMILVVKGLFAAAALIALLSLIDYLRAYYKYKSKAQ